MRKIQLIMKVGGGKGITLKHLFEFLVFGNYSSKHGKRDEGTYHQIFLSDPSKLNENETHCGRDISCKTADTSYC